MEGLFLIIVFITAFIFGWLIVSYLGKILSSDIQCAMRDAGEKLNKREK